MSVAICRRRPKDGEIEVLGRVVVLAQGTPAVIMGRDERAASSLETLLSPGITGPDGRRLFLADGSAFLAALPDALRGSRLWAEREPESASE